MSVRRGAWVVIYCIHSVGRVKSISAGCWLIVNANVVGRVRARGGSLSPNRAWLLELILA